MATLSHSSTSYTRSSETNWLNLYTDFLNKAEFNRIGWALTAMAVQGCVLSPVLLLTMAYFGGGDWQFLASMFGFLAILVPVLSAMPVKVIFPAFLASTVVHLAIILMNVLS